MTTRARIEIIVLSSKNVDILLGEKLAEVFGFILHKATDLAPIRNLLTDSPNTVLLWEADKDAFSAGIARALPGLIPPWRTVAISEDGINKYPHLFNLPVLGHHIVRRTEEPLPSILGLLISNMFDNSPFGIEKLLPPGAAIASVPIKRSKGKLKAVKGTCDFLIQNGINERLANTVSASVDEVITNAIFDAPINAQGEKCPPSTDMNADFDLPGNSAIELKFGTTSTQLRAEHYRFLGFT